MSKSITQNKFSNLRKNQKGIVLMTILLTSLLLTFIGISMADYVIKQYARTSDNVYTSNALLTAEAGIEQSLNQVNSGQPLVGFPTETEFYDDSIQGRATYQTEITAGSGPNETVIKSTGRTYRSTSTDVIGERSVKVTIVPTASPGYSVHSGPGGLIMNNGVITNSKIYVNGKITMSSSGSVGLGTYAQPLEIFVANADCPSGSNPGPSYPQQCSSGEPITMPNWGSGKIYGSICATGQTQTTFPTSRSTPQIEGGSTGSGLMVGCTAPPVAMPTYDRNAHIASMTTTVNSNDVNYNCSKYMNPSSVGFKRTWPAKIRLNGDVSMVSSCDLTITGDVYITGDLEMGGNAKIRIADSLGTTRPVIVVDGDISTNTPEIISNSSGTGAKFISFKSTASCSPNCTDLTGTELKNSQNVTTVDIGGGGSLPGAIFQSYWGKIRIGGSGSVGSAIGQTIEMNGNGSVNFGTALATGSTSWTIRSYQYDFD